MVVTLGRSKQVACSFVIDVASSEQEYAGDEQTRHRNSGHVGQPLGTGDEQEEGCRECRWLFQR